MSISFKWNKGIDQISDGILGTDAVQLFTANEAKRLMDPYVPSLYNTLARNVRVYVENGKGVVHYLSVFAHYQYKGIVMVDPVTGKACFSDAEGHKWSRPGVKKVPTSRKLKYTKFRHPLATSYWDKAMSTSRSGDLAGAVQRFIAKRG